MFFVDLEMSKASPGRGVITQFLANTKEDSFAHFLTYNTENTISLWKIKPPSQGRFELDLMDNIQLDQPPCHIAFRGDSIALATGKSLVTLQVCFVKRGNCSVKMFQHSKDEGHQKSISQVRRFFLVFYLFVHFCRNSKRKRGGLYSSRTMYIMIRSRKLILN